MQLIHAFDFLIPLTHNKFISNCLSLNKNLFQIKWGCHHILGTPYILHVTYLYGIIVEYFSINYILTGINNTRLQISFKEKTHGCKFKKYISSEIGMASYFRYSIYFACCISVWYDCRIVFNQFARCISVWYDCRIFFNQLYINCH